MRRRGVSEKLRQDSVRYSPLRDLDTAAGSYKTTHDRITHCRITLPKDDSEFGSRKSKEELEAIEAAQATKSVAHQERLRVFTRTELFEVMLDLLALNDLQTCASLCQYLRASVKGYLYRRVNKSIHHWVEEKEAFRTMMRVYGAAISGSVALDVITPLLKRPTNLNVYTAFGDTAAFLDYFVEVEKYKPIFTIPGHQWNTREGATFSLWIRQYGSIRKVSKLQRSTTSHKGETTIATVEVIESYDVNAISPMFHFNATWAMNWITADSVNTAYPKLTLNKMGSLTSPYFAAWTSRDAWLVKFAEKYKFKILDKAERQALGLTCGALCPARLRHTGDKACLRMGFDDDGEELALRPWIVRGKRGRDECSYPLCPRLQLGPVEVILS